MLGFEIEQDFPENMCSQRGKGFLTILVTYLFHVLEPTLYHFKHLYRFSGTLIFSLFNHVSIHSAMFNCHLATNIIFPVYGILNKTFNFTSSRVSKSSRVQKHRSRIKSVALEIPSHLSLRFYNELYQLTSCVLCTYSFVTSLIFLNYEHIY